MELIGLEIGKIIAAVSWAIATELIIVTGGPDSGWPGFQYFKIALAGLAEHSWHLR